MQGTPSPGPGQVWWCDGPALCFEPHFKRRPVLIVALEEEGLCVIPLSSSRHFGQETAVRYENHVSYLTGDMKIISLDSLRAFRGHWAGFEPWRSDQEVAAQAVARHRAVWQKIRAFLRLPGRTSGT